MGVTHGKKRDQRRFSGQNETHLIGSGQSETHLGTSASAILSIEAAEPGYIACLSSSSGTSRAPLPISICPWPGHENLLVPADQNACASVMQTRGTEYKGRYSELQVPPLQTEEETNNLIRSKKTLNSLMVSKSHQELHKELRMTHKRRVSHEGKSELLRALEKRKWEQRMKADKVQEVAEKNRSPLHQELLKRHERLEKLERDRGQQQEGPEFLRVKERLRRTAVMDAGEKQE